MPISIFRLHSSSSVSENFAKMGVSRPPPRKLNVSVRQPFRRFSERATSALMTLSLMPDGLLGPCVKIIFRAESANAADGCPALFERDEAAIGGAAPDTVNGAPFIGLGDGRSGNESCR
jgi:hypothetical protein